MRKYALNFILSRTFTILLIPMWTLLAACSDSNNNDNNNQASTLGVPGAGNPNTVAVPAAEIEGPIAGDPVLVSTFFPLGPLGYERVEYFASGTANAYVNVNELQADGKWQVQASEQTDYKTRIVVIRPIDPADFNGTVIVEWLNVSAGFDNGPDWGIAHTEMIRSGYAWVGVSAQKVGIDALLDGSAGLLLGRTDTAERYASLHHPGESFSYDIYSQVAQAIRQPGDVLPMNNFEVRHLIAIGQSQGAAYLMTYVNAIAPLHAIYNGYLVHSRYFGSSPLQGAYLKPTVATPPVVRVRDDLGTPVLMLQTESDLLILGSLSNRQDDSSTFRLWEVAGTSHADRYTVFGHLLDTGANPETAAVVEISAPIPGIIDCDLPINSGPHHFVANAAIAALNTWIVDGRAPSKAERLEVAGEPAIFVRDDLGNVNGGVRTPYVDAPIAIVEGVGQPQADSILDPDTSEINLGNLNVCAFTGTTKLFDAATLGSLYTDNAAYIEALNTATDEAVSKGFLRPADAKLIKDYAAGSDIFAP